MLLEGIILNTPITVEGANSGIIITILLIAFLIITCKPDFSRV